MKNKILYKFLPVFFFVMFAFIIIPLNASAAYVIDDLNWNSRADTNSFSYSYYVTPSLGKLKSLTSSSAIVDYTFYNEFDLSFRFSADDYIFKYPSTQLLYHFDLSCNQPNFVIDTTECYLVHDGVEYPLTCAGSVITGFINKIYIYSTNTYFDLKVKVKGHQNISQNFSRSNYDDDLTTTFNPNYTFGLVMSLFTQYESSDNMLEMSNKIDMLLAESAGIQGAIENQTQQSIQNTDKITNGYNSSDIDNADDIFNEGAGDLTDIEDTLTDSSSSYVDNFTTTGFDTSFLQSVGPSLNYVVTWFTNFWNMGGALTSTYGLSFAIFIAFYILRVRG